MQLGIAAGLVFNRLVLEDNKPVENAKSAKPAKPVCVNSRLNKRILSTYYVVYVGIQGHLDKADTLVSVCIFILRRIVTVNGTSDNVGCFCCQAMRRADSRIFMWPSLRV